MKLIVNGSEREIHGVTLAEAMAQLGHSDCGYGTAVNGQFVPARQRTTTLLTAGDRIEIVVPMQGG